MKLNYYFLWALWGAMIISMVIRWQADTYMVVALIVIPPLLVLLDLHGEIAVLKEESKHQRKFVLDRYAALSEKITDLSNNLEKKLVVDFAEFAKKNENGQSSPQPERTSRPLRRKKKRRPLPDVVEVDLANAPKQPEPGEPQETESV